MMIALILRNDRGVAALELALMAPILLMLLVATADFSLAYFYKTKLEAAVHSGGTYALLKGSGVTEANIEEVVSKSADLAGVDASGTSYSSGQCYCFSGGQAEPQAATCAAECTGGLGDISGKYVKVQAAYTYQPMTPGAAMFLGSSTLSLSKTTWVRVE